MLNTSMSQYQPSPSSPTTPAPVTTGPKTVTAPTSTTTPFNQIPQKIIQEISESPLLPNQILAQEQPTIRWQTAAIIGVGAFFLGAFFSMIVMFWLY